MIAMLPSSLGKGIVQESVKVQNAACLSTASANVVCSAVAGRRHGRLEEVDGLLRDEGEFEVQLRHVRLCASAASADSSVSCLRAER